MRKIIQRVIITKILLSLLYGRPTYSYLIHHLSFQLALLVTAEEIPQNWMDQ